MRSLYGSNRAEEVHNFIRDRVQVRIVFHEILSVVGSRASIVRQGPGILVSVNIVNAQP
jgi:hypothetical protein